MPITLEKILSPTAETSFEWSGETVNLVFAPLRYTGEMQEFVARIDDEDRLEKAEIAELREEALAVVASANGNKEAREVAITKAAELNSRAEERQRRMDLKDRKSLRDFLASDGDGNGGPPGLLVSWDVMNGKKAIPTTRRELDKLPDIFLQQVLMALGRENQPDPPKAPISNEP